MRNAKNFWKEFLGKEKKMNSTETKKKAIDILRELHESAVYASNYTGSIFEDERAAGESETSSIIETLCNLNFNNIE